MKSQAKSLIVMAGFALPAASLLLSVKAGPMRSHHIPTIFVELVTVTEEDVDQAAKFCLIKEGFLENSATKQQNPTPAQTVVMATICN